MSTYEVSSVSQLHALISKHMKEREKKVVGAIKRAARKASASNASALKRNIPVAFGEIRESVHVEGLTVVVDAPHAAAVNNGSRPHTPPLAPLVAWVKLRGMQGLATERQQGRMPGTSTRAAAAGVAGWLGSLEHRGPGGYSDVDAAEQVARMIQRAIARKGTKPHHFIEKSMPEMFKVLDEEIRRALGESGGGDDDGGAPSLGGGGSKASADQSTSGAFRKKADTFRGSKIQTDHHGRRFADLKNGKRVFIRK